MLPDIEVENGQSLLWRIEGNGLQHPSWIFGTMHIIPTYDFQLGERLKQHLLEADEVVFEIDLNDKSQYAAVFRSFLPDGASVRDYMSKEAFDSLKSFVLDTLHIGRLSWISYQRMKPVFLSEILQMKAFGADETSSFEMTFLKMANEAGIPVSGLETADYQMQILDSIPLDVQINMLMQTVRDYRREKASLDTLIYYYRRQWIDSLASDIEAESTGFDEYNELLIYGRNHNWIPVMNSLMQKHSCFFAVGAAHLPGEKGVLQLLREAGYTVRPVQTD